MYGVCVQVYILCVFRFVNYSVLRFCFPTFFYFVHCTTVIGVSVAIAATVIVVRQQKRAVHLQEEKRQYALAKHMEMYVRVSKVQTKTFGPKFLRNRFADGTKRQTITIRNMNNNLHFFSTSINPLSLGW